MANNTGYSSPSSPPPVAAEAQRPRWFISRGNGVFVPLVPADELPEGIHLLGAPRQMNLASATRMEFVGEFPPPTATYRLMGTPAGPPTTQQPPMEAAPGRTGPSHFHRGPAPAAAFATPPAAAGAVQPWRRPQETGGLNTRSLVDAIAGDNPGLAARVGYVRRPAPPSGREPDEERKEFCTFWIRTGECDYTQQGCRYKHEMPDLATLERIGFRGVPKWWKERTAASSTRAAPTLRRPEAGPSEAPGAHSPAPGRLAPATGVERQLTWLQGPTGANEAETEEDDGESSTKPESDDGFEWKSEDDEADESSCNSSGEEADDRHQSSVGPIHPRRHTTRTLPSSTAAPSAAAASATPTPRGHGGTFPTFPALVPLPPSTSSQRPRPSFDDDELYEDPFTTSADASRPEPHSHDAASTITGAVPPPAQARSTTSPSTHSPLPLRPRHQPASTAANAGARHESGVGEGHSATTTPQHQEELIPGLGSGLGQSRYADE